MGFILGVISTLLFFMLSSYNITHEGHCEKEVENTLIKDYKMNCLELNLGKETCNKIFSRD